MSDEKKFVTGLWVTEKELKFGPIQELSFKVEEFIKFLEENKNAKGYVNVTIKKSKESKKPYAELNTWEPSDQNSQHPAQSTPISKEEPDDLPF